jgi:muramoyltetrapeptide carboxypeptidase LdcA involved in peptidoglycan recycling
MNETVTDYGNLSFKQIKIVLYFIGFGSIKLRPEFKVKKIKSNQKPLVCFSVATASRLYFKKIEFYK